MSEIGPENGISYRVISSNEERKPSAAYCGFGDLGAPSMGVFRMEAREYAEYRFGMRVRTWVENVETFVRCESV